MAEERLVAGVRCGEVLADLSSFIDGTLPAERVAQLQQHVAGCDLCERFGADFKTAIEALRGLRAAPDLSPEMIERLHKALNAQ